ncbi:Boophilin-H2, partial [Armadillidium vulgare]
DTCSQPIERGLCHSSIIKYGFDIENGKCVEFIYGGCFGNANNFETIEECMSECGGILQQTNSVEEKKIRTIIPKMFRGPCKARLGRFGFNPRVKRCEIFTYGGCDGNENNFLNFDACVARCGGDPS